MSVKRVRTKKSPASTESRGSPKIDYMSEGETNIPPENLLDYCVLIYGEKGIGKTTLSGSVPGAYVNQLEPGRRNVRVRQTNVHPRTLKEMQRDKKKAGRGNYFTPWEILQELHTQQIEDDSVTCIIEDTIDQVYKICLRHVCFMKGISDPNDANDFGQTWRAIYDELCGEYSRILDSGKGLWFISHSVTKEVETLAMVGDDDLFTKTRNREEKQGIDTYEQVVPSCEAGAFKLIKQLCDFAFYYGYHERQRMLRVRANRNIWAACGSSEYFCDEEGTPLEIVDMGNDPKESYARLQEAFNNKVSAPVKKRRRSK